MLKKRLYQLLAVVAVCCALVGVMLPVWPTTPFLLVALFATSRSSPEWHERLRKHPKFGATLQAWEDRRAVPKRAKIMAPSMMLISWFVMFMTGTHHYVLIGFAIVAMAVSVYLWSRPSA